MPVHCVYCIHDSNGKYYINIYVSMLAMFLHTSEKVVIHLLHDATLTDVAKKDFDELCATYGHSMEYHVVPDVSKDDDKLAACERYPNTHVRFYIPYLLSSINKAIYLDADIIATMDIGELFRIDLKDKMLAAAPDCHSYWDKNGVPRKKDAKKVVYLGLKPELYSNSGVLLMNLDLMRSLSPDGNSPFMERLVAGVADGINMEFPDQDAINSVMVEMPEKLLVLDKKFNFPIQPANSLNLSIAELEGKLVHIMHKPWSWVCPAQMIFWKYYALTKFSGDMFDRIDAAFRSKNMRFLINYCKYPKYRRHVTDYSELGLWGMIFKTIKRKLGFDKTS